MKNLSLTGNSCYLYMYIIDSFFFFFHLQETHIIHTFEDDFYGSELSVVILGFIRPEKDFPSLG